VKIAIMMRAMDQDSGLRFFVEGLVETLLRIDGRNTYLLFYRNPKSLGRFSAFGNAKEILLAASHKLFWDQVAVPYRAWRENADIIFNPKFSVPLFSHCPVTMGLQEPAWWAWPQHYEWLDVHYERLALPLYCRKAAHLFPMSYFDLEESRKYTGLPMKNATVTWAAPSAYIRRIQDESLLESIRVKYRLPRKFIFSVTRVLHAGLDRSSSFFAGKNPETTLRAFQICRDEVPHELVFAGKRVRDYLLHAGFREDDFEGVRFLDFVPHEELAGLYNLADLFVIPSQYEGFGLTLLEAMTCGCPVVASRTGACPEIGGGAAILADPRDPVDFADKIRLVLHDEALRNDLRARGLSRATYFSWEKTALNTILGLEETLGDRKRKICDKSHGVSRTI
jgi:glycosyltransferase involved in cell wall biosynthesis